MKVVAEPFTAERPTEADGFAPVLPPLAKTKAVVAICVVFVPTVAVGAVGVPESAGPLAKTAGPVPVSSVKALAKFALEGVARKVATPVPSPEMPDDTGNPVPFVSTIADGIPRAGEINVGDVA